MRFIECGQWDWDWALRQFQANRAELQNQKNGRQVGFNAILSHAVNGTH